MVDVLGDIIQKELRNIYRIIYNITLYLMHKGGNYMNYIFLAKGFTLSEDSKQIITKKMNKLAKFFTDETEVHVAVSHIKQKQVVEVTIIHKGLALRAEAVAEDIISSIERAVDTLERQIQKHKTRLEKRLHTPAFTPEFILQNEEDEEKDFDVLDIAEDLITDEQKSGNYISTKQQGQKKIEILLESRDLTFERLIKDLKIRDELIRDLRKNSSLSLKQIGELFEGISESRISRILSKK